MNKMLVSAAVFNWTFTVLFVFALEWSFGLFHITPVPENRVFVDFFALVIGAFGVGYFWAACDFEKNRQIVKLGAYAKFCLVALGAVEVMLGRVSWQIMIPLMGDLLFVGLFFMALAKLNDR